jgi:hypothetical protein
VHFPGDRERFCTFCVWPCHQEHSLG